MVENAEAKQKYLSERFAGIIFNEMGDMGQDSADAYGGLHFDIPKATPRECRPFPDFWRLGFPRTRV